MPLMPLCIVAMLDGVTIAAIAAGVAACLVLVIVMLCLNSERLGVIAGQQPIAGLALRPGEVLLTGEVSVRQAREVADWPRITLEQALYAHQISDESPEAAPVREKKRRTRVLSLLHRVTETTEVPVAPIIEPRTPAPRSAVTTVNESRRRRLEELLRRLGKE